MNDFYYDELLDASFEELKKFASWMNRFLGHYPTIVGGWAVWCYTKGLGSRDIDVVFMNALSKDTALNQFFFYNRYEEAGTFLEKSYVKKIKTERGEEEITIDACTAADSRVISGLDITLPWKWAIDCSKKEELSEDVYIYIPTPELLLTYKIGAALGRIEALKTIRETAYTGAKLWKDFYDVASLIKACRFDRGKLKEFFKESGIDKHIDRFMESMAARSDILESLKLKEGDIRRLIP